MRPATAALFLALPLASGLDNGLGIKPQLGFNSWNAWGGCGVNETLMRQTIDAFVSLGLKDVGFEYVSMDDCWQSGCAIGKMCHDPASGGVKPCDERGIGNCTAAKQLGRHPNGTVIPNPVKFSRGVKALADHAHQQGLKFGLYSSNSPKTCGGHAGSQGYEEIDARTYAGWGVDLLKYDNCANEAVNGPPERGYAIMRDALNATGRPILFSACEWAVDFPGTWMGAVANSWRSTFDIENDWECVVSHVDWTNVYADYAKPGAFNDMDILEVGNAGMPWAPGTAMTMEEWRAHYSLWIVMKAPIMIGCDLSTPLCKSALPLFLNKEMLKINQDDLGVQAKRVRSTERLTISKSGKCRSEELPQNTVIAPCDANDALQRWSLHPNGTISMVSTGECLQLDSGQGGDCSGAACNPHAASFRIWANNAASAMCDDPASCCGAREQLWTLTANHTVVNNVSGQCLTVHAEGMHNVGVDPCSSELAGFQVWDFQEGDRAGGVREEAAAASAAAPVAGRFVSSSVALPSGAKSCLARTDDVAPGRTEVFAGPLAGGDRVVLLFNRNRTAAADIGVSWRELGLAAGAKMKARDLWRGTDVPGTFSGSFEAAGVPVHGVKVFRLSKA